LGNVNPAFQDILNALSNNIIKVQYGHKNWDSQSRAQEIFANMSYLKANCIEIPEFDGILDDIIIIVFKKMFFEGV